jgi:L-seryl-tRNA(Ser) seleniumtransferase
MPSPRPPSVERVLAVARPRLGDRDPAAVVAVARAVVDEERERLRDGAAASTPGRLADLVVERLGALEQVSGPASVVNATGVIVHTNLGRASWPAAAIEAARAAASEPLLLELDRSTGRRGRRYGEAEDHLVALTGAEDALVVGNNAAAVALAVGLAARRGVAVARGELVEIGGGVRIPDVIRRTGARLVEVGTTNRTRVEDFEEVLAAGRATVVLRVHPSNFVQSGFVEAPDPTALAALAHDHGALVVDDLGSGALVDTAAFGLAHEPMPHERLAAGADVVCFSGDKLVGGPQAGLLVGRADLLGRLRKDPLTRAMRPDKTILAAMAATLALYRAGVARREIPVWRMIATPAEVLRARAESIVASLGGLDDAGGVGGITVERLRSTVGGGSLPGQTLPSWGVGIHARSAKRCLDALRAGDPAVIARIEDDLVLLDLRTVPDAGDAALLRAIPAALDAAGRSR